MFQQGCDGWVVGWSAGGFAMACQVALHLNEARLTCYSLMKVVFGNSVADGIAPPSEIAIVPRVARFATCLRPVTAGVQYRYP